MAKKKAVKTKKVPTELIVVLDKSGSMGCVRTDTIGGFNTLLADQKKLGGDIKVSLALFNAEYSLLYDGVPIKDVKDLDDNSYVPSGSTALLDAVGRTIDAVNRRIDSTPKKKQPKKVIVAIITDGQENASSDFTKSQIQEMIKTQQGKKWEFVFLGANQDAFAEGASYGIAGASSCNFKHTGGGVRCVYLALSAHTQSHRTGGQGVDMTTAYTAAEKKNNP